MPDDEHIYEESEDDERSLDEWAEDEKEELWEEWVNS